MRLGVVVSIVLVVCAGRAVAQTATGQEAPVGHTGLRLDVPLPAPEMSRASVAAQPRRLPPPPQREPRRRPSMVGYINDASIGSMVRVRFDAGFGVAAPDRGEFFMAKCGCYRDLPIDHPFLDPDAPGPRPGITTDLDFQQLYVMGEFAPSSRFSVFGEVPVRWTQANVTLGGPESLSSEVGLSDVRLGVKVGLASTATQRLTVQLQAGAPTGDPLRGLGSDRWSVEPALLHAADITERLTIESQVGAVLPLSGSAGLLPLGERGFDSRVLYYGTGAAFQVVRTPSFEVAPVVELVGWRLFGGYQTTGYRDVDGLDIVNLKLGARVSIRGGSAFYVGYGRRLSDAWWYEDLVRVEYRLTF